MPIKNDKQEQRKRIEMEAGGTDKDVWATREEERLIERTDQKR